jgi:thymidylate synthase
MQQYKDLINLVLNNGISKTDRTGVGTISVFGAQSRYDLSQGFPLLTLKKTHFKGIAIELLWFLMGDTYADFLDKHNVTIWKEWTNSENDLPNTYAKQWRGFEYSVDGRMGVHDQIKWVISEIKRNPDSRRLIVSAWHPVMAGISVEKCALPACHTMFQFYVANGKLSCQLYQRSGDLFLGIPYNIASYALLTHLIAKECNLDVGDFVHTIGDLHLYNNHVDQAKEVLKRDNLPLPTLEVDLPTNLIDFIDEKVENMTWDEIKKVIKLSNYTAHPPIKAEVAV